MIKLSISTTLLRFFCSAESYFFTDEDLLKKETQVKAACEQSLSKSNGIICFVFIEKADVPILYQSISGLAQKSRNNSYISSVLKFRKYLLKEGYSIESSSDEAESAFISDIYRSGRWFISKAMAEMRDRDDLLRKMHLKFKIFWRDESQDHYFNYDTNTIHINMNRICNKDGIVHSRVCTSSLHDYDHCYSFSSLLWQHHLMSAISEQLAKYFEDHYNVDGASSKVYSLLRRKLINTEVGVLRVKF